MPRFGLAVERHVEELLGRSEGVSLRRWLSALPAEAARARPRLCLARAYGAAMGFQTEALEALLDDAERALAAGGGEPYEPSLGPPQGDSVLATSPRGSRSCAARSHGFAAMPPSRPATTGRPWPSWARTSG